MSLRSLNQTYTRMKTMQRTLPLTNHRSLKELKLGIDKMYQYRNDELRDTDTFNYQDETPREVQNICYEHVYHSFKEYEQAYGIDYSLSIGDINDALDTMTDCTCNARQLQECLCVSRNMGNFCECNARDPIQCMCVARIGGKYPGTCVCNTRYAGCKCVSRQEGVHCTCNGRCSCNSVNEFSFEQAKPLNYCDCVSRSYGDACECHVRTSPTFTISGYYGSEEKWNENKNQVTGSSIGGAYHSAADNINIKMIGVQDCDCQARSIDNKAQEHAPWDSYCGSGHMISTTKKVCSCNARTHTTETDYCKCVSRISTSMCEYHVVNN